MRIMEINDKYKGNIRIRIYSYIGEDGGIAGYSYNYRGGGDDRDPPDLSNSVLETIQITEFLGINGNAVDMLMGALERLNDGEKVDLEHILD